MSQYKPTQDYLLITPDFVPEQTESGLFIPEQARKNANEGVVIDVGPNCTEVQKGDRVVFSELSEYRLSDNGENILVVQETNVILRKPAVPQRETTCNVANEDLNSIALENNDVRSAPAFGQAAKDALAADRAGRVSGTEARNTLDFR